MDDKKPHEYPPEMRDQAIQLLAERHSVAGTARILGVRKSTIQRWRDHPEAQRRLAAARAARDAAFLDAIEDSRRILREAIAHATQRVVDLLDDPSPEIRLRAALAIQDRAGLPSVARAEVTAAVTTGPDLGRLSVEQLEALRDLAEAARGR